MSAEEVGAYIRLLCYQWNRGQIPTDPEKLLRVAGADVSPDVMAKFPGGKNPRMEAVRKAQQDFRLNRSTSGKRGADSRWLSHGSANGSAIAQPMANRMAKHGSPSPSPSPSPISDSDLPNHAKPAAPRARNECFDALCVFEGIPLGEVTAKVGKRIATALSEIKSVSPAVTRGQLSNPFFVS